MSSSINCHYCIYSLLTCFLPLSEEVVVDLARAEDELPDTVGVLRGGPVVGDEAVELAAGGQVVEGGLALRQAEAEVAGPDGPEVPTSPQCHAQNLPTPDVTCISKD